VFKAKRDGVESKIPNEKKKLITTKLIIAIANILVFIQEAGKFSFYILFKIKRYNLSNFVKMDHL
jgi:hypothetical protein